MPPELTEEQRLAFDEHSGQPVLVRDTVRNETFVLLTAADYEKVRNLLDVATDPAAWNDEKNRRRLALIDRRIADQLTTTESLELAVLQRQAEVHFDRVAPPPLQGVIELHQQLTSRDSA